MSTWTLIIMLLATATGNSAMTNVPGFSSRVTCEAQAVQIQQVQVDRGDRRMLTMCVEVQ